MFTRKEIKDLLISLLVLSFALSMWTFKGSFGGYRLSLEESIVTGFFITVIAFLSHEIIGHKFFAQKYGFDAEYKMWNFGLILLAATAIITALSSFNFIFAAPGAVYIYPSARKKFAFSIAKITEKQYGIISLAGPAINIIIGLVLLYANFLVPLPIFFITSKISFYLALFNMIPFFPLDGSKVFAWNKIIWLAVTAVAILGVFF